MLSNSPNAKRTTFLPLYRPARVFTATVIAPLMLTAITFHPARAQELLINGGFETGNFTGWTLDNRPLGEPYDPGTPATATFVIDDNADSLSPLSGLPTLGPASGSFFALSDMTAQGTHVLLQSFTVPLTSNQVILSFSMYVYDFAGAGGAIDVSGLDHTTGGSNPPRDNQHARVDLLSSGVSSFDTNAGSVLQNFYLGVDSEAELGQSPQYRTYSFDISGVALAGQTYQLRFGEVDNQFVLHQAVDNVSVQASFIPEPGTLSLFLSSLGVTLLAAGRSRMRARRSSTTPAVPADPSEGTE